MNMKHNLLSFLAILSMFTLSSCHKDIQNLDAQQSAEQDVKQEISITIQGEFGEMSPDTKSAAQTVSRIYWAGGETVYVYENYNNTVTYLGALTADVDADTDGRIALLSGTLSSAPQSGKMVLIHSQFLNDAPTLSNKTITIPMGTQWEDDVRFVAYAVVDFDNSQIDNLKAKFIFATSVLFTDITGLLPYRYIYSAGIVGINTNCTITINANNAISIGGSSSGTITKSWAYNNNNITNDNGRCGIYIAIPVSPANRNRFLRVRQENDPSTPHGGTFVGGRFATVALTSGKTYLAQQNCTDGVYLEGDYSGNGTFVPETGVWWAPVNCGNRNNYAHFQWARRFPFLNTSTPSWYESTASNMASGNAERTEKYFYKGNSMNCWYSNPSTTDQWIAEYDPCPRGWRVPTVDELGYLVYTDWDEHEIRGYTKRNNYGGVSLPVEGRRNYYDGSIFGDNSVGYYWSSSTVSGNSNTAYCLLVDKITSESPSVLTFNRSYGLSVRCVQDGKLSDSACRVEQ